MVNHFSPPIRGDSQVPDALTVYRQALAAAPNGSVTLVSVGFATNILDLLVSRGDAFSPLDGRQLIAAKVTKMVMMGGRQRIWDDDWAVEWNFGGCGGRNCGGNYGLLGGITDEALTRWPRKVPIEYIGFEAGMEVRTGFVLDDFDTPCGRAYRWFCEDLWGWCQDAARPPAAESFASTSGRSSARVRRRTRRCDRSRSSSRR